MKSMKRLLSFSLAILSLSVCAQNSPTKLSQKEKKQLSTFMSNFSEVSLPTFDQKHPLSQTQLLKFAIAHKQYQEWMALLQPGHKFVGPGQTQVLTKEYVVGITKRYFGVTLDWAKLPQDLVSKKTLTIHYGGERIEATYWTVAKSLTKVGDLYRFTGQLWVSGSGDDESEDGTVEALLKKTVEGWNLVAYTQRRTKR